MAPIHNIHNLSATVEHRLETAIKAFDSGDKSKELFDEFIDLIDKGSLEANYYVGCMYEASSRASSLPTSKLNVFVTLPIVASSVRPFS